MDVFARVGEWVAVGKGVVEALSVGDNLRLIMDVAGSPPEFGMMISGS